TGLLSDLTFEDEETAVSDDDFLLDLFEDADEGSDELEIEPESASIAENDEVLSLTELLSDVELEEESVPAQDEFDDGDDWLADLTNLTEEETEPADAADDLEEEVGLTGMLANLWPDEEEMADSSAELIDDLQDTKSNAVDELGLTELLAGIDYEEDAVQSDPVFPDFDNDPVEPSLTEILTEIEDEPTNEADEHPISAEDTTWLNQLEADTGSLQEQEDAFDLAEESGLDWLTTPDEPEVEEEVAEPEGEAEVETAEPVEADGTAEDWDDAMSWLDELAAQQDEPIEELPSVAETMLDEELDTAAKLATTAPMDDEGLDWLDDLTKSDDDASSLETIEEILDEETKPELPETHVMAEEDSLADLDDLAEDDEISWLDDLATDNLDMSVVEEDETLIESDEEMPEPLLEDELLVEETTVTDESIDETIVEDLELEELEAIADTDFEDLDASWLDAIMEEAPDDEPEESDPLDELTDEAAEPYVVVAGVTDALKMDSGIEEAEADLEEALAWLDDLDEEETASEVDEAPETVVDLPTEELESEEVPETIIVTPEPDALALALDRLEQTVLSEGISVPNTAVIPLTLSSDELSAALDWIVEAETVEDEPVAEASAGDDASDFEDVSDDPEAWLEQMLNEELNLDIEMAPPPIKPSEDALFVTEDAQEATEPEATEPIKEETPIDALLDDVGLEGLPDDPDAAVAWLDQIASDQDKSGEVDPAELTESAIAAPIEEGDDPQLDLDLDDPEAWLEQMLSDEMALDVDMAPPPIKPSEDALFVTDGSDDAAIEPEQTDTPVNLAKTAAAQEAKIDEAEIDSEVDDLFDDPEAMLAQLLSDDLDIEMQPPAIKPSEDAVYVTGGGESSSADDDAQMPEPELDLLPDTSTDESETISDGNISDIIADVPDDPDEAMAWLEQLAAQQGADIDELPSITDVEEVVETAVSPDAPIDIEETTPDEDVTSELPDWLGSGDEAGDVAGETDWLRSLPEVDMETWLSAEEEATLTGAVEEVVIPDIGPLSAPPQTVAVEELDDDDLFEPVLEPSTGAYNVDEAQLTVAQDALANGRLDEAISQFKQLVTAGSGMMTIIAELEQAAGANPQKPAFHQVLGDAYMRNGQLQKALASYRSALDQM
ncbi:Cell division protein FtsK, partial [hydrothermal vent metagenome]